MRVAFFSPLPPSQSGIADYSEALIRELRRMVDLELFSEPEPGFDPRRFDMALYQVGNNPWHDFVYAAALRHPGVVVLHEANLHHLVAERTIKRGDWDAYLRECEYEGGPAALEHARRVRALETGPDYEGVPMTRRLLEAARGVVVHSRFMAGAVRAAGFRGPLARIPHGAWIPEADRMGYRQRLGLDELTPLIGIFGHLKPYKRIAESLRAFRRLVRVAPQARLILAGEPHPDFPVQSLIQQLDLAAHARVLGFVPAEDFTGYLAACDIVLNLRYPTVGESSGSLLRALGLGKAVVVSDLGSFAEFPDDVVCKAPVGAGEEEVIFEYLNLLVSRPDLAQALGRRARCHVERECNWQTVAEQYARFLAAVVEGREYAPSQPSAPSPRAPAPETQPADVETWVRDAPSRAYFGVHRSRLLRTLQITPPGGPGDRVLDMGAYLQITPALQTRLGYGEVRGCYFGPAGQVERKEAVSLEGERFTCDIDLFDAERDRFPYPDEHFATVLCCELMEHLVADPMHMMSEIHRVLKPGGHLVLTTPNVAGLRSISAILQGYHPGFFHAYIRPGHNGQTEPRHSREYTPKEVYRLLDNSGFTVTHLETGPFLEEPRPEDAWVGALLERYSLPAELRGDDIYIVGQKTGTVRERYPSWLYA